MKLRTVIIILIIITLCGIAYYGIKNNGNGIEILTKTNIEDITLTDSSINYTVNLSTLKLGKSSYKKIYEQGSIKRQIELSEAKMNWMCE